MKKMFALLLAMVMVLCLFAGCGSEPSAPANNENPAASTPEATQPENTQPEATQPENNEPAPAEPTLQEKAMAVIEEINAYVPAGLNAYTMSMDDVVALLVEAGAIAEGTEPVNMAESVDYLKKYDDTYDLAMPIADIENDYNGVMVLYFDLLNGSAYAGNLKSAAVNGGTIPINGGMYTFSTDVINGAYALKFGDNVDETVKEAAKAAFEAVDATKPSIELYSMDELAMALQKAKLISITDLAEPANLNETYSYEAMGQDWVGYYDEENNPEGTESGYSEEYLKTYYVAIATQANGYGAISIYFFDTGDDWFGYTGPAGTWNDFAANMQADGSTSGAAYYDPDGDWEFEAFPESLINVDVIVGNFALSFDE